MERLHFNIHINATRERVWNILWDESTYATWTAPFGPGGRAVSDWREGSKVHFLAANGHGMFSRIYRVERPEFIGFEHLGTVKNGEEQPADEESRKWEGSHEEYRLEDKDGGTQLFALVDVGTEHTEQFRRQFPEALAVVKELAEGGK